MSIDELNNTFDIIKTLIEDKRYEQAIEKLTKLSISNPTDSRVWKYMILIMTNNLSGDLDPKIPLDNYSIKTKIETITLVKAVELYQKYEQDEEEKYKIMSAYNLILDRYSYNRNLIEQQPKQEEVNDHLYKEIYNYVISQNKISASFIQRKYRLTYNRAAKLIDILEEKGVISPANGSKPRDVLIHK